MGPMKVVAVSCSPSVGGKTRAVLEAVLAGAAALGAETREDITLDDLGRGDSVIARRTVTSFPPIVGKWRPA